MNDQRPTYFVLATLALLPIAAATPAATVWSVLADACSETDNSAGFDGQDVDCVFECLANELVSVTVTAVDEDADVSGQATCGTATPGCSGHHECSGEEPTTSAGEGTCEGHSTEFWDSGLTVSCESDTIPCENEEKCEVGSDDCLLDDICLGEIVGPVVLSRIQFLGGGQATGVACDLEGCVKIAPICDVNESGVTCRIGAAR